MFDFILICESGSLDLFTFCYFCREEHVQVKLIELTLHGDLSNAVRDLIGQHDHSGQRQIGIAGTNPAVLCPLLIGVCPVIDLVFDKLAGVDGSERCAGQEQIVARRDGQEGFIISVVRLILLIFLLVEISFSFFIRIVKQFLSILTPCTKAILVKDDQIPIGGMDELILGLDAAVVIGTQ